MCHSGFFFLYLFKDCWELRVLVLCIDGSKGAASIAKIRGEGATISLRILGEAILS